MAPRQSSERAPLFRSAKKICLVLVDAIFVVAGAVGSSLTDRTSAKLATAPSLKIPPCGRGLRKSPWCEIRIVQGLPTCFACNCIAPGNLTVPSSWC
jgi:hypothetical protein